MIDLSSLALLKGKKALVTGIANDQSIAWGCAKAFHAFGSDVAVTYLNDKSRKYVEPLAKEIKSPIFMPLDLQREGQLEAVFESIEKKWGKLDLCLHSIAFAPKADLQGRVVDCNVVVLDHHLRADGKVGRAPDEERRNSLHDDLLRIRVHAISPGPLKTRAASGISDFR
jgi:enoyl-[acyl-carrier-protein] reductase (NADH)